MKKQLIFALSFLYISVTPFTLYADDSAKAINSRLSTGEVENQINLDQKVNPLYEFKLLAPFNEWKADVAKKNDFNFSLDYNSLLLGVSDSPGEESAGSGVVRFYGFWDLLNRGGANKGSLNWKIENRHKYTDIPPSDLGFQSGYAGIFGPTFSDQGNRLTSLYWKQYFADGKAAFVAGFLDVTDYVDVYLLASPWTGFNNFVFSTGSAAMDLPNDATLGTAVGGMVTSHIYAQAGISDANADPTRPFDGVDAFVNDNDYFKWMEIGFVPGQDKIYFDNAHLTFWHVDQRKTGTPDGWGINASWQRWINDKWLPFIRGGYTNDSGSLLERSITVGIGYQPVPMRGVVGFGFNWGKPNQVSFKDARDQYTTEVFWRYQLTKEVALTPSVQYIKDPALNAEKNNLWVYGIRVRIAL